MQVKERKGLPGDMELHLVNTIDEAWAFKRWASERHDHLGFDTETSGLDPRAPGAKLRLVQIGDEKTGWAIPWELWGGVALEIFNSYEGQWIAHNIAFDAKWLEIHGGWKVPWHRSHDTMIMAQVCDPLGGGALKPLSVKHVDRRAAAGDNLLKEAMSKEGWGWADIPVDYDAYWAYGALDPVLTCHLYNHFRADQAYPRVYELEMATRRVISRMEDTGARIDLEYCENKFKQLTEWVEGIKTWGKNQLGISLGSNLQLIKHFEKLGAEITRTTKSGNPSVDKYQLKMWANDPPTQEIGQLANLLLQMRHADKMASSYFSNFLSMHNDGVLHPSIKTLGARTGRMSMTNPALQTLPKGEALIRDAFIPHDGHVLISSDYSQIEMRLMAHFSQDQKLISTFIEADASGSDFFTTIGSDIYQVDMQKSDKRRGLVKNCVPLDSQILTNRGWLSYSEVKVGDLTPGYNFETRKTEWTRINEVYVSDDEAEIYEFGNARIKTRCTADHRWVTDSGRGVGERMFSHAYEVPNTERRVITAAPFADGSANVSDNEALILGWVLGDGSIKRGKFVGAPAQGRDGHKVACYMSISQSKPHRIVELDALLAGVPHRRYDSSGTQTFWAISPDWSRDLLARVGIEDKQTFDPWAVAASLSGSARRAMLDGLNYADGKSETGYMICQAADAPVTELCVALMYFLGYYPKKYVYEPDGTGWTKNPVANINAQHARFTGQKASMTLVSHERVWCVSTELGTWTMRQDGCTPILTGNTMYGKAYGAGITKMAETAGVPYDQMKSVVDAFDTRYPGVKNFQKQVEDQGVRRERGEGQGYVVTPFGRRLPCDEGRIYSLTNYLLQGHAAELLKDAIVRLDHAGLSEYMLLPVHDEIIFSVPEEDHKDVMHTIGEVMSIRGMAVDVPAEPEGPLYRWGDKYRTEDEAGSTPQEMITP